MDLGSLPTDVSDTKVATLWCLAITMSGDVAGASTSTTVLGGLIALLLGVGATVQLFAGGEEE